MTRLIEDWIIDINDNMESMENNLIMKTGMGYLQLASRACGIKTEEFLRFVETARIAVIPVTTGQGRISFFTDSVSSILRHMGFDVFTTIGTDVDGMYEACINDADIIFMADDDRFIALNIRKGAVADNGIATARNRVE